MAATVIYKLLDPARLEIRVVHLHGSPNYMSIVKCDLEIVSLLQEPSPQYEAISYCWGEVGGTESILLNGQLFDAPASSVKVLRRFRQQHERRTLWIDALCIDQSNLTERSQQVPLMRGVYNKTTTALIWVGDGNETSEEAVRFIKVIANKFSQDMRDSEGHFVKPPAVDYGGRAWPEPLKDRTKFQALELFFQRPWFSRTWVLQEAALAPKSKCHCGQSEVDWRDILCVTGWIYRHFSILEQIVDFRLSIGIETTSIGYMLAVRSDVSEGSMLLHELLARGRRLKATDQRDKIYGMLGLFDWDRLASTTRDGKVWLEVDYFKPASSVFRDAIRAAILEARNLDALAHAGIDSSSSSSDIAPSWVPQFNAEEERQRPWTIPQASIPCAGRGIDSNLVQDAPDSDTLLLGGFLVDYVTLVVPPLVSLESSIAEFVGAVLPFFSEDKKDEFVAEFMLNMTAGRFLEAVDESDTLHVAAGLRDMLSKASSGDDSGGNVNQEKTLQHLSDLYRYSRLASDRRQVFLTDGGMIGLGPLGTKEGDCIAILFGGQYPFVLRLDSNAPFDELCELEEARCRLVGQCYIQKIVEMGAVVPFDDSKEVPTVFEIW